MPETVTSTVWGQTPWSDQLLTISGDVERGRAPQSAYTEQLLRDFVEYHGVLREAGITYQSGDWGGGERDYLRSTVLGVTGFETDINGAPVTRWFDTNTFYRQPTIQGSLELVSPKNHGHYQFWLEAAGERAVYQPTFLSPYAFAKLSERAAGIDDVRALTSVSGLYDQLLDDAAQQGVERLLFHEPYATYHQVGSRERQRLKQTIDGLAANHPAIDVGVYFSFGDAGTLMTEFAEDEQLAVLGCDLQKTAVTELPQLSGQSLLAGLVDGANSLVDSDQQLAEVLEEVQATTGAAEISITHTIDLEHLPRLIAFAKIEQLGRIARVLGGVLDE